VIVGLDARPALFGRTGFGRVVRQALLALGARDDVELRAYGAAWRRARADCRLPGVSTPPLPARVQQLLAPLGFGVETLLGPLDVYHHTDLVFAPVARTPEVLTIYDLVFLHDSRWHAPGFARRLLPRLLARVERAAALVVPCARVADDVVHRLRVAPGRVHVVPLGVDHLHPGASGQVDGAAVEGAGRVARVLARVGLARGPGAPLVLLPGTREPRKNQLALLQSFLRVRGTTGAVLLLVGPRGWGCADLEQQLQALQRDPAAPVRTAGEVDEAELGALLRAADIVAYPSLAEGFGLPVAEALSCGRAVLTSRDTPMADYGGDALLAVDPRDPTALDEGLRRLLHEPGWRAALGARGAQLARPWTWAAHAQRLVAVYRQACGSGRPG